MVKYFEFLDGYDDGFYLDIDLNKTLEHINSYAKENGLIITSVSQFNNVGLLVTFSKNLGVNLVSN